jgi:hypothetical protein
VARRFGCEGHRVGPVARDHDRLAAMAADLRAAGVTAAVAIADARRATPRRGVARPRRTIRGAHGHRLRAGGVTAVAARRRVTRIAPSSTRAPAGESTGATPPGTGEHPVQRNARRQQCQQPTS